MEARARRRLEHSFIHLVDTFLFEKLWHVSRIPPMRALGLLFLLSAATASFAADFGIQSSGRNGQITWSNAYLAGVVTIETKGDLFAPWIPRENYFTSNLVGSARISLTPTQTFVRLLSVDISTNTPNHYTNLLQSYGILETIAGRGRTNSDASHWSN